MKAVDLDTPIVRARNEPLLTAGVIAGPLFIVAPLIQAFARQGFDLTRHAISMLLLGNLGWIQFANFEVTGLLALLYAVGMWRRLHPSRAGTWGPILVGAYGVLLIIAGIFPPDAAFGFPPGAPDAMSTAASGHANLHAMAFLLLLVCVIAASFVFVRRFASIRQWDWMAYCIATGVAGPVLFLLGAAMTPAGKSGLPLLGVAILISAWIAIVAARLLAEQEQA
jgi:hypothetical protein